ncbi:MAG TPA: cytochrome C oxidase subunit IV family protein [Roseiflexaceae bacterium]|nr:cytochrome C oxidase subunit IV family protein [Roseiflexaceae bacterium]
MAHGHTEVVEHQDAHHDEAHGSTQKYWVVGIVLAIITAVEVIVTFLPFLGFDALLFLLMIMAFAKGILIVAYFMHLRGDAGIFKLVFMVPFVMASLFLLAMMLLFFTPHVGIAG